jgi:putative flavoprotein involved in K+ transport
LPDPQCVKNPILEIDLKEAGINSIVWATGFDVDFSWLKVDALDENGKPKHDRGISTESGIYFLGLPWQSRRGSSFIWGVWQDAKFLADQIQLRTQYLEFDASLRASKR